MKITANQTFLHETDRYEEGKEYDVEEKLGFYFVQVGWADSTDVNVDVEVQPTEVNLEIDDSTIGTSSETP